MSGENMTREHIEEDAEQLNMGIRLALQHGVIDQEEAEEYWANLTALFANLDLAVVTLDSAHSVLCAWKGILEECFTEYANLREQIQASRWSFSPQKYMN